MVPSRQPDVLHLLWTIAPIIAVDYNVLCHDPLNSLLCFFLMKKTFASASSPKELL